MDADFDKAGGRHVLLLLFGTAAHPACEAALRMLLNKSALLNDQRVAVLGITVDHRDTENEQIIALQRAGMHFFIDADRRISTLYDAIEAGPSGVTVRPYWLLLDRALRVTGLFPLSAGKEALAAFSYQINAPIPDTSAPALILPDILDPPFAAELIALHSLHGGQESGVMRRIGDATIEVQHQAVKRRRDYLIQDASVQARLRDALRLRLVPMIERSFQYRTTEIERYIVSCYDSKDNAHFAPHRDNTTPATAHRRFAVTMNLNSDYEGGDLRFPEFGSRSYRAPCFGAIVFSCSLLHEVTRVTAGRRYATLPFLYGGGSISG